MSDGTKDNVIPLTAKKSESEKTEPLGPGEVARRAETFLETIAEPGFEQSLDGIQRAFRSLALGWKEWNDIQRAAVRARMMERLSIDGGRFDFLLGASDEDRSKALRYTPTAIRLAKDEAIYPRDGFFGDYLAYAQAGEAHVGFHFWSAVGVLAAAMRRNFRLDAGGTSHLYPHLYLMLVGSTGSGKGTAAKRAIDLLKRANLYVKPTTFRTDAPTVHIVAGDHLTTSAIVQSLLGAATRKAWVSELDPDGDQETCALLPTKEAMTLFGRDCHKPDEMIAFLTNAFDGEVHKATRMHGVEKINNLSLTCLFLSTMHWLRKAITDHVFQGGFMGSRLLPIPKAKPRGRSFHREPALDPMVRDRLARQMAESFIMRDPVEILLDTAADNLLREWYEASRRQAEDQDERIKGYMERRDIHLLKLATILTVAYGREPWLTVGTLGDAIRIMAHEEPGMFEAMFEMTQGKTVDRTEKILQVLAASGGEMDQTRFFRRIAGYFNSRREMLDEAELLVSTGRVARQTERTGQGPGRTLWRQVRDHDD